MNLKIVVHSILILVCQPSAFAAVPSYPTTPLTYPEIRSLIDKSRPELAAVMLRSLTHCPRTVLANPLFWLLSEKEQECTISEQEKKWERRREAFANGKSKID